MRFLAALCLCVLALQSLAQAPQFGASLAFGGYPVGFAEYRENELAVAVWYPAAKAGAAMTFRAYLGERTQDFEAFLLGAGLSPETARLYLDAQMTATRDARPAAGTHPLVLMAQGNRHDAADQAVLCEYLASHGFIVATAPSPMLARPMADAEEIGTFAQVQAEELWRSALLAAAHHETDLRKIGIVGHSFGARAALLLAMTRPEVRALVSLDGGIGSSLGVESMRQARWFRAGSVPPLLHLYETEDAFVQHDLAFLRSTGSESLHTDRIEGVHHAHFSTVGFAAAALPELRTLTRAGADIGDRLSYVARRTLLFLSRHVR